MRPEHSFRSVVFAVAAVLSLVLISAVPSDAPAQSGGTLVIALDQEPPTLDPHASPSAVTYQIIGSVTENLLYRGPDGKLTPWVGEEGWALEGGGRRRLTLRR